MTQPINETKAHAKRWTVDRREITYSLEVVQQPEKARACGSGARSSADRRPVDPPPVVELRVYANGTDVTMSYDATFMLYASLEVARPIAGGKMHTPQTIPVLTGVAVASAAYLERPKPAAYFIFPDLSVRHEGWYRLKFSLFEGVKHEMDADLSKPFVHHPPTSAKYTAPVRHESMYNRLEVQSIPFQVFSAKKFPGLNTSTALSRAVAEQGCRVRIRRDIRQRKRAGKPMDNDGDDAHSSCHGTPQASYRQIEHSRSASRNSMGSQYDPIGRRQSIESMTQRPELRSRQPSISSMTASSPSNLTSSMPPPAPYQGSVTRIPEHSPISTPYDPARCPTIKSAPSPSTSYTAEIDHRSCTLPLPLESRLGPQPGSRRPLYETGPPQTGKRQASSRSYDSYSSLKDRARPDAPKPSFSGLSWPTDSSLECLNQPIEADTSDNYDDEDDFLYKGPMSYPRADGSHANKNTRLPHYIR